MTGSRAVRHEPLGGPADALILDPGGTTGYALVYRHARRIDAGQLTGHEWEQVDAALRLWLAGKRPDPRPPFAAMPAFVIEGFNLRADLHEGAKSRPETLSPVRLGFAIEWAVYRLAVNGVVPRRWATDGAITRPGSSDAMTFATDERLKRWGVYVPGDHARDAVRHACLWVARGGLGRDECDAITGGKWTAVRVQ